MDTMSSSCISMSILGTISGFAECSLGFGHGHETFNLSQHLLNHRLNDGLLKGGSTSPAGRGPRMKVTGHIPGPPPPTPHSPTLCWPDCPPPLHPPPPPPTASVPPECSEGSKIGSVGSRTALMGFKASYQLNINVMLNVYLKKFGSFSHCITGSKPTQTEWV